MLDGGREAHSGPIVRAFTFSGALHSSGGKGVPFHGEVHSSAHAGGEHKRCGD